MEKAKVLVVEDDMITARSIEAMIVGHGMEITALCRSGEEALLITEQRLPDLVILDIKLHGKMTGIQVAEALQNISPIPVIYLSDYTDKATVRKAKETHPVNYLAKPFTESDLLRAIDIAIENARAETAKSDHNNEFVFVKKDSTYLKLRYEEIVFVEADRSYCKIQSINDAYTLSISMASVAGQLNSDRFIKIHRSYIVNIRKITEFSGTEVIAGGHTLPVSDQHRAELMNRLNILH